MAYLLGFVLIIVLTLWEGLIVWNLWDWFLVPLGAMEIGFIHAMGLGLFAGFLALSSQLKTREQRNAAKDPELSFLHLRDYAFNTSVFFFLSWLVHLFM